MKYNRKHKTDSYGLAPLHPGLPGRHSAHHPQGFRIQLRAYAFYYFWFHYLTCRINHKLHINHAPYTVFLCLLRITHMLGKIIKNITIGKLRHILHHLINFPLLDNSTLFFRSIGSWETDIRVAFSVQNVFVITGYSGVDPEIPGVYGIDGSIWPRPRTYSLRLNINF